MYWTDDPVADAERYIADQDAQLKRMPKCCVCENHIQDEYLYDVNGLIYCEECMSYFRKAADRYEQ